MFQLFLRPKSLSVIIALFCSGAVASCSPAASQSRAVVDPDDPLPRADERTLENLPGLVTHYSSVEVDPGIRLRTLITVPEDELGPLKPLLFTQWVSCGSIEFGDGDGGMLATLAKETGLALVRVDRAGAGDSQGPGCDQLDYNTEVEHYTKAFAALLGSDLIDPSQVFVYGASLGSTTAPLIADALQSDGFDIAAIAVQGGGALTHYERMLNFDRLYLERRPEAVSRDQIHDEVNARAQFHVEYLIKGRHPDEVAADSPGMAAVRSDIRGLEDDNHYGRPFAWHQQAAHRDFLAAWSRLDANVLVIFNEFDQFETKRGHKLIADTVNRLRPGSADFVVQKGLGHSSWRFSTIEEAYAYEAGVSETATTGVVLVDWFKSQQ